MQTFLSLRFIAPTAKHTPHTVANERLAQPSKCHATYGCNQQHLSNLRYLFFAASFPFHVCVCMFRFPFQWHCTSLPVSTPSEDDWEKCDPRDPFSPCCSTHMLPFAQCLPLSPSRQSFLTQPNTAIKRTIATCGTIHAKLARLGNWADSRLTTRKEKATKIIEACGADKRKPSNILPSRQRPGGTMMAVK